MANYKFSIYLLTAFFVLFCSCKPDANKEDGDEVTHQKTVSTETGAVPVKVAVLDEMEMSRDIMSNGKIETGEIAEPFFTKGELVTDVWVKEGQRVRKGDKLARIDSSKEDAELEKLKSDRERSFLDLQDVLIGQGYDPANVSTIPKDVMRLAMIRSGLDKIDASIKLSEKEIARSVLTAPCDGVIADVKVKKFGIAKVGEPVCRILNDRSMAVEFNIMESELPYVHKGERVKVESYSTGAETEGVVSEINPIVDDKGLVRVKALLKRGCDFGEGMNVKIKLLKSMGDKLVAPKGAVVLRSGREVIFTLDHGKAIWNYVVTGVENSEYKEILEGVEKGDTLIIAGNENLAHNSPVRIK